MEKNIEVYFIFADKDKDDWTELKTHLDSIKAKDVEIKSNLDISAGAVVYKEIKANIESCDILLVGISSNFMSSMMYKKMEKLIFDTTFFNNALLVPILLKNCDLRGFKDINALPNRFVSEYLQKNNAFYEISKGVQKLVDECRKGATRNILKSQIQGFIQDLQKQKKELETQKKDLEEQKQEARILLSEATKLKTILEKKVKKVIEPYEKTIASLEERLQEQERKMKRLQDGIVPLYRFWSERKSDHHFTIGSKEIENLKKDASYQFEHIECYVLNRKIT
ncbi:MAG: hypothetical protein ACPG5B_01345 [Chitinophagales bacterium]